MRSATYRLCAGPSQRHRLGFLSKAAFIEAWDALAAIGSGAQGPDEEAAFQAGVENAVPTLPTCPKCGGNIIGTANLCTCLPNLWPEHGSPELDEDAAKLVALGADPGPKTKISSGAEMSEALDAAAAAVGESCRRFHVVGRGKCTEWFVADYMLPAGEFAAGPFDDQDEAHRVCDKIVAVACLHVFLDHVENTPGGPGISYEAVQTLRAHLGEG